jgi:hypothetical protein
VQDSEFAQFRFLKFEVLALQRKAGRLDFLGARLFRPNYPVSDRKMCGETVPSPRVSEQLRPGRSGSHEITGNHLPLELQPLRCSVRAVPETHRCN